LPWKSVQQARWGHSPEGLRALGGKAKVAEWDTSTPKGSLPKRAGGLRTAAKRAKENS